MKMEYLAKRRAVKKFVIRGKSSEELQAFVGIIKSNMYTMGGILVYEKLVAEASKFFILSFEDSINMAAWEYMTTSAIGTQIIEIVSSKVLNITDKDNEAVMKKKAEIRASINEYNGAVLREKEIKNGYELLLFFTDESKMEEWQNTFNVQA